MEETGNLKNVGARKNNASVEFSLEGISYRQHLQDLRNWRRTLLLMVSTIAVGAGIGLMILTELGASPLDAAVVNMAYWVGVSVGTFLLGLSLLLLVIALFVGKMKPVLGTIISFIGISLSIDLVILFGAVYLNGESFMWVRIVCWFLGAVLLGAGASGLVSAQLGASPYDQFIQSFTRFGFSFIWVRVLMDIALVIVAFLLGGVSVGVGTFGILIIIPLILKYSIPPLQKWARVKDDYKLEKEDS